MQSPRSIARPQAIFPPRFAAEARHGRGFSLVEVVLALGVVSVGLVGIMGLLPAGLGVFRQSVNTTTQAQIAQQIINDAQLTPYASLVNSLSAATVVYYFDESGGRLAGDGTDAVYAASVCLSGSGAASLAELPGGISSTLLVRIANKACPQYPASHSFILVKNN